MKLILLLLFLAVSSCLAKKKHESSEKLRGIAPDVKELYNSKKDFKCLDGSETIPFAWINDDYCDCPDGSDEPGTAACNVGKFHCVNKGHSGVDIPSSRVNDQICDCCDGSDEYAGFIQCPNICVELGRQAREEAVRQKKILKEGYTRRLDMIREAQEKVADNKLRLEELRKEKEDLDPQRDELEIAKKEAEELESAAKKKHEDAWKAEVDARKAEKEKEKAKKAFETLDQNGDGKISFSEIMPRLEFDKDGDGEVSEGEAREVLADEEPDLETFVSATWDTIKDTFSKGKKKEDDDEDAEDDLDLDDVDERFDDTKQETEDEDKEEEMPPYDEDTLVLIDTADKARDDFNEVDKRYQEIDTELKDLEKQEELDLGPDEVFSVLRSQCFTLDEHQYKYNLCLFDKCTQEPKSGGSTVSLGNWGEWSGTAENKYSRMKYKDGQSCWNGPNRSTEVILKCGIEEKLLSASEPGRCQYQFEFETPAACIDPAIGLGDAEMPKPHTSSGHTEL